MALVYFDSSAFVKLLVEESGSELAAELCGADAVHLSSALALEDPTLVVVAWDDRLRSGVTAAGFALAPASI